LKDNRLKPEEKRGSLPTLPTTSTRTRKSTTKDKEKENFVKEDTINKGRQKGNDSNFSEGLKRLPEKI